jgi:hypothetical protein
LIGATGAVGPQGPVGPIGPQGQQGSTGPAGPSGTVTILTSNVDGEAAEINEGVYSNAVTYASINLPAGTTAFFITCDLCPDTTGEAVIEPQINFSSNGGQGGTSYSGSNASAQTISGVYIQVPASQSWGVSSLPSSLNYTINLQYTGASDFASSTLSYDYTITCWS